MIERVTDAIEKEGGLEIGNAFAYRLARAAVAAMREPTDAMCEDAKPHDGSRESIWIAMIDEVLKETV